MLPAPYRMHNADDFRHTVRRGVRAARPTLVVHAANAAGGTRVGFVVSKAVGDAVRRNRVKRRLRHLAAARLRDTPAGTQLVIRALPVATEQPERLPADLDAAWSQVLNRLARS